MGKEPEHLLNDTYQARLENTTARDAERLLKLLKEPNSAAKPEDLAFIKATKNQLKIKASERDVKQFANHVCTLL